MAMKMDVWQWGDVKGVDEELCNNLALFAEDNKIDCMNMTEKEFVALKDEYLMINYGNKGIFSKKSLKESKKFHYGEEIIKFLDKYGYNKRGEDFEQKKDYSTVTYMYAIPKGMRPQTPYVEFTVDADNDAFIFGEFFTDGRKGYSTEFDSVEDLEYFISNANYSKVDLTEKKSDKKSLEESYKSEIDVMYDYEKIFKKKGWTVKRIPDKERTLSAMNILISKNVGDGQLCFYIYCNWGIDYYGDYYSCQINDSSDVEYDYDAVNYRGFDVSGRGFLLFERNITKFCDYLEETLKELSNLKVEVTESKKSIKEGKDSAFFDGIAKEYHFSKDEKTRYKDKTYISAIAVLFDRINNAIKTYGRNSDEEYNALNDCWEVISSAKQNGFNVNYDEDRWNKIAGLPNYH